MTNGISSSETIGLDLSDKTGLFVVIDAAGEVVGEGKVQLTLAGVRRSFGARLACRIAIEVGSHSPWLSRELEGLGYEVIVANARQVGLITKSKKKTDREDAETLARAARFDPQLLRPIQHRGEQAQADLAKLRCRKLLVDTRTKLVTSVRGMVKAVGGRLPRCSTASFSKSAAVSLPECLRETLEPVLRVIEQLTGEIKAQDRKLERLAEERYPETQVLRQVDGVGPLTSLAFVLTLEEPQRFRRSRSVGAYLGMTRRERQSGEQAPQLRISKTGDVYLRSTLVQSAQHILGPFGKDSDLRRWGLRLAGQGNKLRKHKAVIAVARKLSVLLHRLWVTGEVYEPLRQERLLAAAA